MIRLLLRAPRMHDTLVVPASQVSPLRRVLAMGVLLAALTLTAHAQDLPALPKAPQAVDIVQLVLSSSGPLFGASTGTITLGTIALAGDVNQYPIRIYAIGNNLVRTEIDQPNGTSVRILNNGEASFQSPAGKVIHLNMINTLSQRLSHIPALSLLSEYQSPYIELDYVGQAEIGNLPVVKIRASWSKAADASDQDMFLKRTQVTYSIDPNTYQIVQTEYNRSAENDTNTMIHYRVVYSNYQNMSGRWIPTTITTFANGKIDSVLHVASYVENADVSSISFELPEASK